jgi:glycopeptide antibiotics resistance protein
MFGKVPVLPVVIPLGGVLFLVLLAVLRSRRRFSLPRAAVAAVLAIYTGGVVANTVFPIFLDWPKTAGADPLPLALVPFRDYELADAVTNVLVFLPLGMLVSLLLPRPSWWRVLLVVAATSLAIEGLQFLAADLAAGGHIADVNDWLFNILGGAVGFGLFTLLARSPAPAAVIDRFRWSVGTRAGSGA